MKATLISNKILCDTDIYRLPNFWVIDEVTENARKGWTKQILYADDLVQMGETMKELRQNFDEWKEVFES